MPGQSVGTCRICGRTMRPRGTLSGEYPDTVSMHSVDLCKSCRRTACTPAKVGTLTRRKAPILAEEDMTFSLRPEDWTKDARCKRSDPERFYPAGWTMTYDWLMEANRRECASCLVRSECLDYALGTSERYGVWGGVDMGSTFELNTADGKVIVDFAEADNHIALRAIFVPSPIRGRGHGASAIEALCLEADRLGKAIVTSVTGTFGSDVNRLVPLFEDFGFKFAAGTMPFAPGDVPMLRPAKVAARS